jgi:hypothetical protein
VGRPLAPTLPPEGEDDRERGLRLDEAVWFDVGCMVPPVLLAMPLELSECYELVRALVSIDPMGSRLVVAIFDWNARVDRRDAVASAKS